MRVKDLIKILKKLPQDADLIDNEMLAMTREGDIYDLKLRCRLIGLGEFKEGIAVILEFKEGLDKIADIEIVDKCDLPDPGYS